MFSRLSHHSSSYKDISAVTFSRLHCDLVSRLPPEKRKRIDQANIQYQDDYLAVNGQELARHVLVLISKDDLDLISPGGHHRGQVIGLNVDSPERKRFYKKRLQLQSYLSSSWRKTEHIPGVTPLTTPICPHSPVSSWLSLIRTCTIHDV